MLKDRRRGKDLSERKRWIVQTSEYSSSVWIPELQLQRNYRSHPDRQLLHNSTEKGCDQAWCLLCIFNHFTEGGKGSVQIFGKAQYLIHFHTFTKRHFNKLPLTQLLQANSLQGIEARRGETPPKTRKACKKDNCKWGASGKNSEISPILRSSKHVCSMQSVGKTRMGGCFSCIGKNLLPQARDYETLLSSDT